MAKAKHHKLSMEEKLEHALVPEDEQPYDVPSNWVWIRLLEAFDNLTSSNKKLPQKDYLQEGSYAVVDQGKDLIGGFTDDDNLLFEGELPIILFGDHTRIVKYIDFPFVQGADGVKILKPRNYYDTRFFYYLMENIDIPDLGYRRHFPLFPTLSCVLPPIPEQYRIVDHIESLFEKLDNAKELIQNALDTFETRKAAILHKAFTGELTAKWREKHPVCENEVFDRISLFMENSSKKDKDHLKEEQNKIRILPQVKNSKWYKCTIGSVGVVTNGSTPPRSEANYWNGNIPWISSGEVRNNQIFNTNECITELGYENSSVKMLPIGTVLIAMIGEGKTRGQSSVLEISATINQNIAAIIIEHGNIVPKFLWYWLQKQYQKNREKGNGTGPQALNCQRVRELDFIVPPLSEQQEIVRVLDDLFEKEQKAKELCDVIEKIDLIKKAILARAFRGELGTNDPNEESALELLKKV